MLLELIKKRQSTRSYKPDPVPRNMIEKCLEAARLAPSACNSQPWNFIIVDEPALKNKLTENIFSGIFAMNSFAKQAPVIVVVVTSEKSTFLKKVGEYLRDTSYCFMDAAIAAEHFILQAAELGIGTCWIGWFNEAQTKKILKIPADKKISCVITLGYSEEPFRQKNRKTIQEISSFNLNQ